MEFVYFTLAGILLYVAADWVLLRIEAIYGKLLPNRSLFFFGIILIMTMVVFEAIQYIAPPDPIEVEAGGAVIEVPENPTKTMNAAEPTITGPSFSDPANK